MNNQRRSVPVLSGTAWGMFYGAASAALVAIVAGASWSLDVRAPYLISLAYLAILGSVIAFASYLTLLRMVGPGPASYVGVTTPVVAMIASTVFEGYRWTPLGAFGVVLAIAGNWLALKPSRRPTRVRSTVTTDPPSASARGNVPL